LGTNKRVLQREKHTRLKLFTVKKASDYYDLDQSLIYWWIRNKKFAYYKVNKKVLFKRIVFDEFLKSHEVAEFDEQ